jgi:chromate transporter
LSLALSEAWQLAVLAVAAVALLAMRRSVVLTLVAAGAVGVLLAALGAALPA